MRIADQYGDARNAAFGDPERQLGETAARIPAFLAGMGSIAALALTTEATVVEIPEEKPAMPAGPPHGGEMGY